MTDWVDQPPWTAEGKTKNSSKLVERIRGSLYSPLGAATIYLILSPFLALLHQTMVHVIVVLLEGTASARVITGALGQVGFDRVYASVFERALGNIESQGLAVVGPVGDLLHWLAPGLFAPSDRVRPGAWASVLLGDQSSLLASAIAAIGPEVGLAFLGVALLGIAFWRRGLARPPYARTLALLGFLLQIASVVGLSRVRLSFDDLEAMGLSYIFTKLVPLDAETYQRLVVEPFQVVGSALVPLILVSMTYGGAFLFALLVARVARHRVTLVGLLRAEGRVLLPPLAEIGDARKWVQSSLVALLLLTAVLLGQRLFPAQIYYDHPADVQTSLDLPDLWTAPMTGTAIVSDQPSQVEIAGANYGYVYTVDGRRERLRGVGYNVMYDQLSPEVRATRYDRDFAQMRAAGVNTILGWDPRQFDELTLIKAQEHGLGVVLPFHLPPEGRYTNPQYQDKIEQEVLQWVQRFQGYPALRMWGIGNEVVHGMGKNPNTPLSRAFAEFYVRLADKVHALDPDHPVVYRDAEDVYLPPLKNALQNDRRPRPWLVYGVNIFTLRICEVLRGWPRNGLDAPLMVSEFAPSGFSRQDRPAGYRRMWRCIADNPNTVLGGFAYVWSTTGPEAIDRVLGLVTPENAPTDGSLVALGEVFRQDAEGER
ncbi:MAG: hypothetical protein EPO21_05675 [Chloroflexota bacterium]|nr:MAG: hypothetical protein EPO21_05675 [Chloroflexota bacterium]